MNVLDLGLFTAIQSAQRKLPALDLPQLIDTVMQAFMSLPVRTIDHAFISLMACMNETANIGGGNNYRIPHMKKGKLPRDVLGNIIPLEAALPVIDVEVADDSDKSVIVESDLDTKTTANVFLKEGSDNEDNNKDSNSDDDSSVSSHSHGSITI